MKLELSEKQLNLLKEELECLVECTYDSINQPDEEDLDNLRELVSINKQVCKVLQINETNSGCYVSCKTELGIE